MKFVFPPGAVPKSRRRGMALVIVLAFVVLVTFLVVAYITRSQTDIQASSNHAKSVQATEIARLGATYLISGLSQEIEQTMSVDGATGVKATIWPARMVVDDSTTAVDEKGDPRDFLPFRTSNSLSQSVYSGIFDTAYGTGVGAKLGPNLGSDVLTSTASGGRSFNNVRWNAPRLLPFTPSGSAWANCPTWVYVSRGGPVSLTAPAPFAATIDQMRNVSDPTNTKAVVGRFAYIMYDIGGLLDANVAGAPLSGGALEDTSFGEKGSTAFANLQPLFASVTDGGSATDFVGWRIPEAVATGTFTIKGENYRKAIVGESLADVGLVESGLRTAIPQSNAFFAREDLIHFSHDNPAIIRGGSAVSSPASTDADSGVLKYLRTWSRSSNAPMIPDTLPPYLSSGTSTLATANLTIPCYAVVGTSSATSANYTITQGGPIFQRKFPLSRIRWFANNDDNGQPNAAVQPAIKQHFGLTPANDLSTYDTSGTVSTEWRGVPGFVYTSPEGNSPANHINTLAEVAKLAIPREPDFFEWLKAAIDPNTLGDNAGWTMSTVALTQDQSKDFQIIQIGANIIDQVDRNDLPTLILTSVDNVKDRNGNPLVAIGVENLPYINELILSVKRDGAWNTPGADNLDAWLQPEIWMPHSNANKVNALASYSGTAAIQNFRVRVVDGEGWLQAYANYRYLAAGNSKQLAAVRLASENARTIKPRVFAGSVTSGAQDGDDSLTFSLADEDFRDPKVPGQSSGTNAYNNGPLNATDEAQLRQVVAGPEPPALDQAVTNGFKGIFAGQVQSCGIVPGPGPTFSKDYQQRRYPFTGGSYALPADLECLRDPLGSGAVDAATPHDGIMDPGTSTVSFPMGQRYYNTFAYLTLAKISKPANSPAGRDPRPLTVILEAQTENNWVPVQILENVVFGGNESDGIADGIMVDPYRDTATARKGQHWGPSNTAPDDKSNFNIYLPGGECVPGFDSYTVASNAQEQRSNLLCYFQKAFGGLAGGGAQVPEQLSWCRPILSVEDPDPDHSNYQYPLGGAGTQDSRQTISYRNDADMRNPNEYLATNESLSGKEAAGGTNDPRFSSLFFGWSSLFNRLSVLKVDPRTRRFGQGGTTESASGGSSIRPIPGPVNLISDELDSLWDVATVGPPGKQWDPNTGLAYGGNGGVGPLYPNWHTIYNRTAATNTPQMVIADLMRNVKTDPSGNPTACYYTGTEAAAVPRPADYAYAKDDEMPTLPIDTYPDALKSRPVVLNRMFRSPAELGFVFRDVPWKSLDFFSEATVNGTIRTPTSGDTKLLDVFCIEDTPFSVGKIDPNKASTEVWESLLAGALEYPAPSSTTTTNLSDSTEVGSVVQNILDNISYSAASPLNSQAFATNSDVVTALMTNPGVKPTAGTRKQKSAVEAFIRGLSGSLDTRTWNIMIDVVAEAGRLPVTANSLAQFTPKAQRRYWVYVAIDRITGQVIDCQYEPINE